MLSTLSKTLLWLVLVISANCLASPQVELTAALGLEGGKPTLQFQLRNKGSEPLTFFRGFLPWSLGIFEVPMSARALNFPHTEIKQVHVIADYVGDVTIEPGSSLTGVVFLANRFIGLEKYLATEPVVVFWHWVPRPKDREALEPIVGWLIIPTVANAPNNPVNRTAEHPPLGSLYPPRAASGYFHR